MTDRFKCERGEELVGFLYGETATAAERRSCEQHLTACAACRAELEAFRALRGAVREWRAEVVEREPAIPLGVVLPEFARNGRPAQAATTSPQPTAWAALREFFALTPAWARAGIVVAALVVCALAALAVVNAQFSWDDHGIAFHTGTGKQMSAPPQSRAPALQATTNEAARYTQADIDRLTAERAAARAESTAARTQLDAAEQQVANLHASLQRQRAQYQNLLAVARTTRGGRGANGRAQQLVRLNESDDEDLRLSDLLTEVSAGRTPPPPQEKRNER